MLKIFQIKKKQTFSNGQEISKCEEQNDADAGNSKYDLPQFSAKCRKVEKMLNERMDKKLTAKFSQEAPAPHLSRKIFN